MFFWSEDKKRLMDVHEATLIIRNKINKDKPTIDNMADVYEKLNNILQKLVNHDLYMISRICHIEDNQKVILSRLNYIDEGISKLVKEKNKLKLPKKKN